MRGKCVGSNVRCWGTCKEGAEAVTLRDKQAGATPNPAQHTGAAVSRGRSRSAAASTALNKLEM